MSLQVLLPGFRKPRNHSSGLKKERSRYECHEVFFYSEGSVSLKDERVNIFVKI